MNQRLYPIFSPAIDAGRGRTRDLIDQLLKLYRGGKHEGAEEALGVLDVLFDEKQRPFINYLVTRTSAVFSLCSEFARFISSSQPEESGRQPVYAAGMSNATSGLMASLIANDVGGKEVITTSFNFPGVPNAVVMAGGIPRFVDINDDDWCMDIASLEAALCDRTGAIVLTLFNNAADTAPIRTLLDEKGLNIPLIQDASVAMGSTFGGIRPGATNVGRVGTTVYSLATSKAISGLGGGIVLTNDEELACRISAIAYQGLFPPGAGKQVAFGANFKMNDLNAAVALAQLSRRDEIFEKRRKLLKLYKEALSQPLDGRKIALQKLNDETVVTHLAALIPDRDNVARKLYSESGIVTGGWPVNHLQAPYRERFGCREGTLPITERLGNEILFLPFYADMTEDDVSSICRTFAACLGF